MRWLVGALLVLGFHMAHRLNIPQHVTGELLKAVFLVALCGWCVWKMPLAAQLWHAGHARNSVRYLMGVRGVTNQIELSQSPTSADILASLQAAFKRQGDIDTSAVTLDIFKDENGELMQYIATLYDDEVYGSYNLFYSPKTRLIRQFHQST